MVAYVYGRLNNKYSLVFRKSKENNDVWICEVPVLNDTKYIVELYAIDTAGNETYFATILFYLDSKTLKLTFKVLDYNVEMEKEVCNMFKMKRYIIKVEEGEVLDGMSG